MPQQYVKELNEGERRLLAEVAESYDLGSAPGEIARLVVWGERLVATFTAGGRKLFLKEWSKFHETPEEIAFCLDIQHLAGTGKVPIAPILTTRAGDEVFTSGNRKLTLYEYVGEPYAPQAAAAQVAGTARILGVLHTATRAGGIGGKEWRGDPFGLSASRLAGTAQALENSPLSPAERTESLAAVRRLSELLEEARRQAEGVGWQDLPMQPIHGDFCQFNCRFRGEQVVAVVDWDHARLGRRLVDIAHAVNVGLGWSQAIDYYEDFTWADAVALEPGRLASWLAGYVMDGQPLSEREARLLPWVCVSLWPWNVAGFCPRAGRAYTPPDSVIAYAEHLATAADEFAQAALTAASR